MTLRALMAPFVICLALAAVAGNAQAGEYHVYACRTPSGEAAPADGWSGSAIGPSSFAEDTCQQPGGALIAALGDTARTANSDIATWAFEAPAGESIASATLWRAGDADGGAVTGATYEFWLAAPTETGFFEECIFGLACTSRGNPGQPLSAENRVIVPSANLSSHLYASASCGGNPKITCKEGEHHPQRHAPPLG